MKIVYIYIGKPISKISLKTKVIALDVSKDELIDDNIFVKDSSKLSEKTKYVRLELVHSFLCKKDYLYYDTLIKHGLKYVHYQFNLKCNPELLEYIKLVEI